jgi:diguanylate cyclase (GGDEF)-like protein/PAS domain S-box-containing protein
MIDAPHELLQSVIDSTVEGIVVLGRKGHIVLYNRRAAEMWSLPDELQGGDDRTLLWHAFSQLADPDAFLAQARLFDWDKEEETLDILELKDGRMFERRSVPHRVNGAVVGRVCSFRDVTSQRSAERAIVRSERRYRALFEASLAGVYTLDLEGRVLDCNDAFARILGAGTPKNVIGAKIEDFYESRIELHEILKTLADVPTLQGLEVSLRTTTGKSARVLQSINRIDIDNEVVLQATVVDIDDLKRAEEQIRFHAFHDILTCLPNRQLFRDRLHTTLVRAQRATRNTAILFVDIDSFKRVNDTLGHMAGDELLVSVAERLVVTMRGTDTVSRPGGDEFHVIIPDAISTGDAELVARKLLHILAKPFRCGNQDVFLTVSIGVAVFPADGSDAESLMRSADNALSDAKHAGGNTHRVATAELNRRASERFAIENNMRAALDREEFVLHYQPIVDARTEKIVALEALVRWQHPERGLLGPREFIPVAEETGLIIPLGDWIIWRAATDAVEWQRRGMPGVRVSINVSPKQFQRPHLVRTIRTALRMTSLDPELLELEVTESTAAQDPEATTEVMRVLRAEGIRLSIDDIGTGYSSLAYLKHFPVTTAKIDKSFIRTVVSDRSDAAIVTAVIGVAHSLEMDVVAEGVETVEQAQFLKAHRCDSLQGMLFGRPSLLATWLPDVGGAESA